MSASGIALSCHALHKRYDDVEAVRGIDLEIRSGECFGLLGPNGAGKTTTVEILEGILAPTAGQVEILGRGWGRGDRALRRRIGVTLQETELLEKLTVRETLEMFRSFYPSGPTADDALRIVQLEEKAGAWVKKLSGGQKQRLSVATALVGDPDILFLDEPTTGLDPQSRRSIWGVVARFREAGGTVLLTTHYMEEAERLCDRVAIIDHGKIIAQDTPARLIASLDAEHVVEFQADPDPDVEALSRLPGVCSAERGDGGIRLRVERVHQAVPAILGELRRQDVDLNELRTHHATLEDVFVAMTGRHLRDG